MQILMPFEKKHLKRMMHLIPLLMLALYHPHCAKAIDPDDLPRIELTSENIISKEVWLRVKFVNVREPREFMVERDGKQIAGGRMQKTDTLVIDTTASPRTVYKYKAIQLEGTARTIESDVLQVQTLDTTSHAVQWQVDTLGVRGTIFDVWPFSKDNIWAVGEIFIRDSTGREDPVHYTLAQWNGQKWTLSRPVGALVNCMFAFSPNDVWIATTAPYHWDGQKWTGFNVTGIFNGYAKELWGTSSSNMIMVGTNGSIAHYDGSKWGKMESGTTVDLEDVWGLDENHVWATGTNIDDGKSVILQSDGITWRVIYDSANRPLGFDYRFSTLWGLSSNVLILTGRSFITYLNLNDFSIRQQISPAKWFVYRIRGLGPNDLFTTGQASELQHYNGATWHLYPEVKKMGDGSIYWHTVHVQEKSVVVGGFFTGLYGVPVVLRGSR